MNTTKPDAIIVLEQVGRMFPDGPGQIAALTDVSLAVVPGELVAVMGPSGSGKSTLLALAGALDVPDSGRVLIDGVDTATLDAAGRARLRRGAAGFVFQHYNLIDTCSAAENVALPLELDGLARGKALAAAREALERIGLKDIADRYPAEMSGGQRQRVAVARAIIGKRRIILADEPTGALDTTTGEQVMQLIRSEVDAGAAAIVVTHEPRFAAYADRVVHVRDGRIIPPQAASTLRPPRFLVDDLPDDGGYGSGVDGVVGDNDGAGDGAPGGQQ